MILTSDKVEEFVRLYPSTKNSILASKYGVTQSTVRSWAAQEGVCKENGWWFWEPLEERYVSLYYPHMKARDIADRLGKSVWAVRNKYREIKGLRPKYESKQKER